MKLELKHLAPYLPYNLTYSYTNIDRISVLTSDVIARREKLGTLEKIKPILRPLSDIFNEYPLTNDFEGWESEWIEHIWDFAGKIHEANILACPYDLMQDLLSKHFDVFGLIEKGLAVDINTLKL